MTHHWCPTGCKQLASECKCPGVAVVVVPGDPGENARAALKATQEWLDASMIGYHVADDHGA